MKTVNRISSSVAFLSTFPLSEVRQSLSMLFFVLSSNTSSLSSSSNYFLWFSFIQIVRLEEYVVFCSKCQSIMREQISNGLWISLCVLSNNTFLPISRLAAVEASWGHLEQVRGLRFLDPIDGCFGFPEFNHYHCIKTLTHLQQLDRLFQVTIEFRP